MNIALRPTLNVSLLLKLIIYAFILCNQYYVQDSVVFKLIFNYSKSLSNIFVTYHKKISYCYKLEYYSLSDVDQSWVVPYLSDLFFGTVNIIT